MGLLLSAPVTEKSSSNGCNSRLRYGCSAMQGWRTGMEDAHSCVTDLDNERNAAFFGVFDGHGGAAVAKYCGKHMCTTLRQTKEFTQGEYEKALVQAFINVDNELKTEAGLKDLTDINGSEIHPEGVGCTSVCGLVVGSDLFVANAGDSRCVLARQGKAVEMSHDHKPHNPSEHERIQKAGGFVQQGRVNGNLNLSRAIGDHDYKRNTTLPEKDQIITCVPDVLHETLTDQDRFLILACDGVWDVLSNQDAVEFIGTWLDENPNANVSGACEAVLTKCLASDPSLGVGCDNMTCIVVLFSPPSAEQLAAANAAASSSSDSAATATSPTTPTTTPATATPDTVMPDTATPDTTAPTTPAAEKPASSNKEAATPLIPGVEQPKPESGGN